MSPPPNSDLPELLVLRHGETVWNSEGRLHGALDSPLTARGVAQARQQGRILASLNIRGWSWYASPQGRASRTAKLALVGAGPVRPDARLREIGIGAWTGRLRSEIEAERPQIFADGGLGWYEHAPGGEGLGALAERVADFLRDLTGPSVIVTHGITSRVLRCLAMGLPVGAFETLDGGQGVVYRVAGGTSTLLEAPESPLHRPVDPR